MSSRALSRLTAQLDSDPDLLIRLKNEPVGFMRTQADLLPADGALSRDRWVYRIVVIALGLSLLSATLRAILLAALRSDPELPDVIIAVVSGCIGALAGLLAPSPGKGESSGDD